MTADGKRCTCGELGIRDDIRVVTGRGQEALAFCLKTFMSPGRNALVGSFDVVSAAPCRLAAASLGDGARQRRVRCITLWPRLLQWPPRLLWVPE